MNLSKAWNAKLEAANPIQEVWPDNALCNMLCRLNRYMTKKGGISGRYFSYWICNFGPNASFCCLEEMAFQIFYVLSDL